MKWLRRAHVSTLPELADATQPFVATYTTIPVMISLARSCTVCRCSSGQKR